MNSKIFILSVLLLLLSSCGVKSPPVKYSETIVDSYVREYTGEDMTAEEIERTKNKEAIPSTLNPVKP